MHHLCQTLKKTFHSNHLSVLSSLKFSYSVSTGTKHDTVIEIPNRIQREPTDILRALANTVGRDPTATHYKYHDDPYLIPTSNIAKRTYAMAQESGRKAARWIRQEHQSLFQHSVAQPPVKAFASQMVFTEDSEVDENCLVNLIKDSEVADAIFVYKLIQSKNLPISEDIKQSILELLCFYNHENRIPEDYIEERWFKQATIGREKQRKTWKDGELAEQIFTEIEPKNAKSYAAIIRGMCKYYQVERAWHLFQEASEKGFELDTSTFNALISVASYIKESGELRWELCKDLLGQMKERQLRPNVGTLNAVLATVSTISNYKLARTLTLKTLSEFKSLGIEPCLTTWYYVLITLCRERGPVSHVLIDILKHIEEKEFHISGHKDTFFFVTAMDICRNHLHDKNLAKRVDKLLHTASNYNFIGDSYKESIYYRHYVALLCQTEPIETFMETYDLLVPNIYIPEPGIMDEILKSIDVNGAIELIPRMWSDMVIFDHTTREGLINRILKIMINNKPNLEISSHKELNEKFAIIAWDIYSRIDEKTGGKHQKLSFTAQMLGDILTLLSRAQHYKNALVVFNKLDKDQHQIPGIPSNDSMKEFIHLCITEKSPSQAITCIEYCSENGIETTELLKVIKEGFTLDESHKSKLRSIFGDSIFN